MTTPIIIGSTAASSGASPPAPPAQYYVDEGATGTGDGSSGDPWNITQFEAAVFASETTVQFSATATTWTYTVTGVGISPPDNAYMQVKAGDTFKIQGTSAASQCSAAFDIQDSNNVTIDGFTVDGGGVYANSTVATLATADGSDGCTIKNCFIYDTGADSGGYTGLALYRNSGGSNTPTTNFKFIDNYWEGHGAHYDIHTTADYGDCILLDRASNIQITGNTFVRGGGHSTIHVKRGLNFWIANNIFSCDWTGQPECTDGNEYSRAIEIKHNDTDAGSPDGTWNYLIESNELFDCGGVNDNATTPAIKTGGQRGVYRDNLVTKVWGEAFSMNWTTGSTGNYYDDVYIYNNTITNTAAGAWRYIGSALMAGTPANIEYFNNISQDQRNNPGVSQPDFNNDFVLKNESGAPPPNFFDNMLVRYNITDPGADVYFVDSAGPNQQTLTSMETNNPTEVNNNTQSNVLSNFPNSTGNTRADFAYVETGGVAQTTVAVGDSGSGTTLIVGNTRMFKDDMNGMRSAGDTIYIGGTSAVISSIDSDTQITLVAGVSRNNGDSVIWGPAYNASGARRGVVNVVAS